MDKKRKTKAVCIAAVILCLYVGLFFAARAVKGRFEGLSISDMLSQIDKFSAGVVLTVIYAVITAGLITVSLGVFSSARAKAEKWDGENEDDIEKIEDMLNKPLIFTNIMQTTGIGFLTCCLSLLLDKKSLLAVVPAVIFVVSYLFVLIINGRVVELEKKLNPEKKGAMSDIDFSRRWLDSCDEGEKLAIYKAAFEAFNVTNKAFFIISVVLWAFQMIFGTGLLPVISVTVLWSIMNLSCLRASTRKEK